MGGTGDGATGVWCGSTRVGSRITPNIKPVPTRTGFYSGYVSNWRFSYVLRAQDAINFIVMNQSTAFTFSR